jgi:hypothetical protein
MPRRTAYLVMSFALLLGGCGDRLVRHPTLPNESRDVVTAEDAAEDVPDPSEDPEPVGSGDPDVVEPPVACGGWRVLEAGSLFTCGLTHGGALYCWGTNSSGSLGDGSHVDFRKEPGQVGVATDWTSITAGVAHACALNADGRLFCWGNNNSGQLGIGVYTDYPDYEHRFVPTQVGADRTWAQVSAGDWHTCAVDTTGALYCWGEGYSGELGIGTRTFTISPTRVGTASDWRQVSAGTDQTCALKAGGALYCWGVDGLCGLGRPITYEYLGYEEPPTVVLTLSPARVGAATDWDHIESGYGFTCGRKHDGSLHCWGDDYAFAYASPTRIGDANDWQDVSVGDGSRCGRKSDGRVFCWGYIDYISWDYRAEPVQIGASTWNGVTGGGHVCLLDAHDAAYCWGLNLYGQLGDGTTTRRYTPTAVIHDPEGPDSCEAASP